MKLIWTFFRVSLSGGLLALSLTSCHKKAPEPTTVTADVRDSTYYIASEIYLWRDLLPSREAFNPLSYPTPDSIMHKIRTYSPLNSKGTGRLDRWSFAIPQADFQQYQAGSTQDLGFESLQFLEGTDDLRVVQVYPNSPAALAGVQRAWRVMKVNGVEASNRVALAKALSEAASKTATFEFLTPSGASKTVSLTPASYKRTSVLVDTVLTVNSKKVGYLLFDTFALNGSKQELEQAITFLKQNSVSDLVVDLRYNGGGEVGVIERFANDVVPQGKAGAVMYNQKHNSKYSKEWDSTMYFDASLPANNLNLKRIVFITSAETASASELLISVLQPHMEVKLVGKTTLGKPVGYYPFPVMNYYTFPVAFRQTNAAGFGDYFDGLKVDSNQNDDCTHNFGDREETCLKTALAYLQTGTMPARQAAREARPASVLLHNQARFIGAFKPLPRHVLLAH